MPQNWFHWFSTTFSGSSPRRPPLGRCASASSSLSISPFLTQSGFNCPCSSLFWLLRASFVLGCGQRSSSPQVMPAIPVRGRRLRRTRPQFSAVPSLITDSPFFSRSGLTASYFVCVEYITCEYIITCLSLQSSSCCSPPPFIHSFWPQSLALLFSERQVLLLRLVLRLSDRSLQREFETSVAAGPIVCSYQFNVGHVLTTAY